MEEKKEKTGFAGDFLDCLKDLSYMICLVMLAFLMFFRIASVDGSSMVPTLIHGDSLLLISNLLHPEFKRGDVVVVHEKDFSQDYNLVKRVIATEGQRVDIDFEAGIVYLDGEPLEEPYVNTPTNLEEGMAFPLTVPEGCVFAMGDNRNNSLDSRDPSVGFIDQREIFGKAVFVAFPGGGKDGTQRDFSRIGVIK